MVSMVVEFFVLLIFPNQSDQKMTDVLCQQRHRVRYLSVHSEFFLIARMKQCSTNLSTDIITHLFN